jgi:hypothetical protein
MDSKGLIVSFVASFHEHIDVSGWIKRWPLLRDMFKFQLNINLFRHVLPSSINIPQYAHDYDPVRVNSLGWLHSIKIDTCLRLLQKTNEEDLG